MGSSVKRYVVASFILALCALASQRTAASPAYIAYQGFGAYPGAGSPVAVPADNGELYLNAAGGNTSNAAGGTADTAGVTLSSTPVRYYNVGAYSGATASSPYSTYAAFQSGIGTAFSNNTGGYTVMNVITADSGASIAGTTPATKFDLANNYALQNSAANSQVNMVFLYGSSQSNAISAYFSAGTGQGWSTGSASQTPTYGDVNMPKGGQNYTGGSTTYETEANSELNLNLTAGLPASSDVMTFTQPYSGVNDSISTPFTGTANGQLISEVGFSVLGRSSDATSDVFTAVATFSDGSTETISESPSSAGVGNNMFYLFTAPTGDTIDSIGFASTGTGRISSIDNLSFLTTAVPEPASLGLLASAMTGLLLRRRARA